MKKRVLAVVMTLGLGSAMLFASGHGGPDGMGRGMMPKDRFVTLLKQLDLTTDQKARLMDLRDARRDERRAQKEMMRDERSGRPQPLVDPGAFMTGEKFDKEAFKAAMKKEMEEYQARMAKMRDEMLDKRADHIQAIFDILTPEQRTKLIELSKQPAPKGKK